MLKNEVDFIFPVKAVTSGSSLNIFIQLLSCISCFLMNISSVDCKALLLVLLIEL